MEAVKKMSEEARQRDTQNECVKREREREGERGREIYNLKECEIKRRK